MRQLPTVVPGVKSKAAVPLPFVVTTVEAAPATSPHPFNGVIVIGTPDRGAPLVVLSENCARKSPPIGTAGRNRSAAACVAKARDARATSRGKVFIVRSL